MLAELKSMHGVSIPPAGADQFFYRFPPKLSPPLWLGEIVCSIEVKIDVT